MKEGKEPEKSFTSVKKSGVDISQVSKQISDALVKLKPVLSKISDGISFTIPYIYKSQKLAKKGWKALQPYQPEELMKILLGAALVLAGGIFPTMVSTFEAIRASGTWPGIKSSFNALYNNYLVAQAEMAKDDLLDADNNGIPDVLEMDSKALIHRKSLVIIKSINTEQVSDAAQKIGTALFAVLATLRLRLAYVFTIGTGLAHMCHEWFGQTATDAVITALPEESQKLGPLLVLTTLKVGGVLVAWIFTRYIFAFYIAMSGGKLLVEALVALLKGQNKINENHILIQKGDELSKVVGAAGFAFQCYMGFELFFVFKLILIPLFFAEW
eukprot:CAMPEP_0171462936 /NCGR_PEP_ID=MMETSP0945-20130129/6787_1 /TAXON_ID=109269 /ORGANISM="Vaucheria litorea, Strain CCMP2940" /LENGTH=327 /DNA_ID=CAMNT_0011989587 /DNA_START=28 /DNA_END=1008 /DNA_ORIENTATION=-